MASSANDFKQTIGSLIAKQLGGGFRFYSSSLALRRKSGEGEDVLILSGSNKYSPFISLSFHFGRNFSAAKRIEKLLKRSPAYYHIFQYSLRRNGMRGLPYSGPFTWDINIEEPYGWIVPEVIEAIQGMALPFFKRFHCIESARNAISECDSWCMGDWRHLLYLDAAIGDLQHFEDWRKRLPEFDSGQANAMLHEIRGVLAHNI